MTELLVIPGEREPLGEREGVRSGSVRTTRSIDQTRSFHLGSLPLASLAQCSAGNDRMAP
jgi:hypothetical protein